MSNRLKRQLNARKKRKEALSYPNQPSAQQILSEAELYLESNPSHATQLYLQFIERHSQDSNIFLAYFRLAQVARRNNYFAEAIEYLLKSIYFNPDFYLSYIDLGYCYLVNQDVESSLNFYKHAISLAEPSNIHLAYLGALNCYFSSDKYKEDGLELAQQAVAYDSNNELYLDKLAYFLHVLGRWEESLEINSRILSLNSSNAQVYFNSAEIYRHLNLHDQSIASYEKAIALEPNSVDFHVNYSHQLLLTGEFQKAWKEHEWRRHKKGLFRVFKSPHWNGKASLENKTLLLYAEQGFGDTIQFCRYIPLIKTLYNVKIIFQCHPELLTLLTQFKEIDTIASYNDNVEKYHFDYHCSVMSLPYYLGTTSFNNIPFKDSPYLYASEAERRFWKTVLGLSNSPTATPNFKIGIVWHGASPKKEDNNIHPVPDLRNALLSDFQPLLDAPNCTFYSLQKGSLDISKYGLQSKIIDFTNKMGDFAETAAFIAELDLVIGVDTAVIHVASAIGKPTWLLSRHTGCWRWLTEEQVGSTSPWYPKLRVYRQKNRGTWSSEIQQIYQDLLLFRGE